MTTDQPIERETAHCRTCGQAFQSAICRNPLDPSRILARQLHCDPCVTAEQERMAKTAAAAWAAALAAARDAAWDAARAAAWYAALAAACDAQAQWLRKNTTPNFK